MNKRQRREWESRCNQCGKCCQDRVLLKDALVYPGTHCQYLVDNKCSVYAKRFQVRPDCMKLTPENIGKQIGWPKDCGLRRKNK